MRASTVEFTKATVRAIHASRVVSVKLGLEGLAKKANLSGQHVFVRLDLNVPLSKKDGKTITSDKRLREVVPTLKFLKEQVPFNFIHPSHIGDPSFHVHLHLHSQLNTLQGAKVVIATHLGRPEEQPFPDSMKTNIVTKR